MQMSGTGILIYVMLELITLELLMETYQLIEKEGNDDMNNDPAKTIVNTKLLYTNSDNILPTHSFNFSKAMELLERGKCLAREVWDGKRIVYRGYSILQIDNEIKNKKYLISSTIDGSCEEWVPKNDDLFANDWVVIFISEDISSNHEMIISPRPTKQKM